MRRVREICSFDKAFEEELKFFPRSAGIEYIYEHVFKYKKISVMNNAWNNLFKIESILPSYFR